MKVLLSVLVLSLVSVSAHGQRISATTGNDLLEWCESKDSKEAVCLGYIIGATDVDGMDGSAFPEHRRSCVAEDVSNGQVRDIVIKYLRDHPEERHHPAAILVVKAMAQAFPCKSK